MIKHLIIIPIIALQFLIAQETVSENYKWSLGISYQPNVIEYYVPYYYLDSGDEFFVSSPYFTTRSNTAIYFTRLIKENIFAYLSFDYSMMDYYYRNEYHLDYTELCL